MIKRLLTNDYLLFFVITVLVNAGNYGLNLFLGRFLGPVFFAEANVLATLVLMISFIGVAFQLTAAKFIAKENEEESDLAENLVQISRRIGLGLALILLLFTPVLYQYLKFESIVPLIILFGGIPFYIAMSTERGILQGRSIFKRLGWTYLSEMIGRLVVTVALVYIFSVYATHLLSQAIAIGFAVSFVISKMSTGIRIHSSIFARIKLPTGVYGFFAVILFYELCQIIINNSDVILVKHFFENEAAGMYSALALIGRIVFFATWIMVTLLFPKVVRLKEEGKETRGIFLMSLAGVGMIAAAIVGISFWQGAFIMDVLFGQAYGAVAPVLWMYALATALFSCANVFVYYYMSLGNYLPVAISFIAGAAQVIGICLFHQSLVQVIEVQIAVTGMLLACLTMGYLGQDRLQQIALMAKHFVLKKNIA